MKRLRNTKKLPWNVPEIPGHRSRDRSRSSQKQTSARAQWMGNSRFVDISTLCGSVYWGFDVIIYTLTQPIQLLWANEDAIVGESWELIPPLLTIRFSIHNLTSLNNILDSVDACSGGGFLLGVNMVLPMITWRGGVYKVPLRSFFNGQHLCGFSR